MSSFDFRTALTLKGRTNRGLRGFAGKPLHPPLTDIPIAAYLFAAVFDVLSIVLYGSHGAVARELYHAATWVLLGGAAVSVLAALTGLMDWLTLRAGAPERKTANAHAITMIIVTVLVLLNLLLRLTAYQGEEYSYPVLVVLSVLVALLVSIGATLGGSLVYDHGVRVEAAMPSESIGRQGPDGGGPVGSASP